jgi:uncharacterized membrane protein (DUF485 family)
LAEPQDPLRELTAARGRIALMLTLTMIAVYFGFIALIAYDKPLLATKLSSGLTLGIVLGAAVIVVSWLLTFIYVRWTNVHYDDQLAKIGAARAPRSGE